MITSHYPCPACGYLEFARQPGSSEKCPICGWEDDLAQLRFRQLLLRCSISLHPCRSPRLPGSANHVSLDDAQQNYAACGAAERRNAASVRAPVDVGVREDIRRLLDPARDNFARSKIGQPQTGPSR